jgi:hypothetical protein
VAPASSSARPRIYFVTSCARSGSTSLARILDTAANGRCLVEPMPNLNAESRDMMDGRLADPHRILAEQVTPRIAAALDTGAVYGEKNVTLGPFIPHLHRLLRCRFVWIVRDGRDVVRSLMNWHMEAFGNIYRDCTIEDPLSPQARASVEQVPLALDTADYARPRPQPGDPWHDRWPSMSRFQMSAWYWAYINRLFAARFRELPADSWMQVDYSRITVDRIGELFEFLGLEGFDGARVGDMLAGRINSLEDRFRTAGRFPRATEWTPEQRRQFDEIAGGVMRELGYA